MRIRAIVERKLGYRLRPTDSHEATERRQVTIVGFVSAEVETYRGVYIDEQGRLGSASISQFSECEILEDGS